MGLLKRILIIALVLFAVGSSQAQIARWYNYGQDYYKIKTAKDGIHRIPAESLEAAGLNLNSLDPRKLSLYHRGKEVAIFVEGEADGQLGSGDFIEFYGLRNDATLDSLLYRDKFPANPYFNLHSDSTAFFLTIKSEGTGKRMQDRVDVSGSIPEITSFESSRKVVFGDQFSLGASYTLGFRLSSYDNGEGWMSTVITKGAVRNIPFENLGQIVNGGNPRLVIGLTGRSGNPHLVRIGAGRNAGTQRVLQEAVFEGFSSLELEVPLQFLDFDPNGNIVISVSPQGPESADNISITYAQIYYQKSKPSVDFLSEEISVPAGESRISLPGDAASYRAFEITDPNNLQFLNITQNGSQFVLQSGVATEASKIKIQNLSDIQTIDRLERVRFRDYLSQSANYLLVGHRELQKAGTEFENVLEAYASHRASPTGGNYDTLTLLMEEMYNQYAYGEESPVALYNFLKEYYPVHRPSHVLLAGRALAIYSTAREAGVTYFYRNRPSAFPFQSLVPVAGYPFSDNEFVVDLDPQNPNVPAIAIGRIPAKNAQELETYLNKAIEKDELGLSEPWQKELIHLGGGVSEFELDRYFSFLNGFKAIAESDFLGGNVTTYRKRSNNVVEVIDITGDLNEGRSLVTFFGHGSPTILDIDIGFASDPTINYQNKGKYPVMLFNGCDYGSAFGTNYTQGEDWVMTADKGASNILANSSIGVDVFLRRYSEQFYLEAFADSAKIFRTVGEIKRTAEGNFVNRYGLNPLNYSHMEQMILLGDPATRLFPADKPDYYLEESEARIGTFENEPITTLTDSLKLTFVLRNIGITSSDSIHYKVSRQLADGTVINYPEIQIPATKRLDTLFFTIPNVEVNSAGENFFELIVNSKQEVEEMSLTNNQIRISQFISLSGTLHLSPKAYAIENSTNAELIGQIPGKNETERIVIVQLDTAATFNSAYRKEIRIPTKGIFNWPVELLTGPDSVTYFWRSKYQEPRQGETDSWTTTSFSYINNGPEGWTQRVLPQLGENILNNLEVNSNASRLKYLDQDLGFEVFTVGSAVDSLSFRNTQFFLNEVPQIIDNVNNANSRLCPNGSLGLVTFQQKTLQPYLPVPVPGFDILDGRSCGRPPQLIQSIRNAWIVAPGRTILDDFTENVEEGDYVVIFTVGGVNFDDWPDQAYARLKEFGASEVTLRNLQSGDPYILYGRKGMKPGEALEIIGNPDFEVPSSQQTLSFKTELTGYISEGLIITPQIGPARNWEAFVQEINDRPWIQEEETNFDIIGIKSNGEEEVLLTEVTDSQLDLSFINSEVYPYLRLRYRMQDAESTDPADLNFWQVNYTGVPEGALMVNPRSETVKLIEGQTGILEYEFVNVSRNDFLDSIQVNWEITNSQSRQVERFSKKFPALKAGERLSEAIEFNTVGKNGSYEIEIFANPRIQLEQTFRNNQLDLGVYFEVEGDDSQDILDVNFDGVYIMDGDIVSPTVMINAILKNDQAILLKKDTVGLDIFLKRECESCDFERINFSNPNLTWTPASENTDFRVAFQPGPLEDGLYTLRVQNEDSPEPYQVNFEVINESQITNFYPYPNPFSTSVRFVFTLTGTEIPDEIKIQIMTVTGRVVREILQDELGPIRIGNNITEYAWDGRDEYGDQLANGVYIYRVLIRKNGQFMEHRPSAGDRAFKQGYGKMYLLR
ncbi:C25 family cysteine peptidase [uncultured Algoriphagus sp.]|uniref:putative type IX secretion system sortase PorU2 n=1 Tax=uncultured Algoriphagus sp. TaxID=417365 RepID=UPI00258C325A|nr:C25 family cysteine peptidase [uncultured Algoriphagus sp.]